MLAGALVSALRAPPTFDASYGAMVALLLIAELRPLVKSDQRDPGGLSISEAFVFALLLHWGLAPALLAMIVTVVAADLVRGRRPWRTAFNIGQYALSYGAAAVVLIAASVEPPDHGGASVQAHDLPAIAAAAIAFFLVNDLLVAGVIMRHERVHLRSVLLDAPIYRVVSTTAVLCLAPLLVVVAERSAGFLPLLLVPLYAVGLAAARAQERERQALHDPLTGLANRTQLLERARPALTSAGSDAPPVALLMVDLDGFKDVNDTFGHLAGDELLRLVGARLTGAVRPDDMVARFGGDEFAILLSDLSAESVANWPSLAGASERVGQAPSPGQSRGAWPVSPDEVADQVAGRIRHALGEPYQIDGMALTVGASVGTAVAPASGADIDALLHAADVAMYAVKAQRHALTAQRRAEAAAAEIAEARRAAAQEATRQAELDALLRLGGNGHRPNGSSPSTNGSSPAPESEERPSATERFLAEHGFSRVEPVGAASGPRRRPRR